LEAFKHFLSNFYYGAIMINPNNDSYKDLWHKNIGKADFASNNLTIKDVINYKKSEMLSRTWKSLELGYAGKGIVDADTITTTLRQIPNKENLISRLSSVQHKLIGQAVGETIKNDPSVRLHINSILRSSSVELTNKNIDFVLNALSKAIGHEVEHSLSEKYEWDRKQCLSNLNVIFNYPSELVAYEPGGRDVFDSLVRLDMNKFAPLIEGKLDFLSGVNSYLAKDLSKVTVITATTDKIAKQINNLSDAIYFLNLSNQ
jgi:hypothetical protein